MKRTHDIEVQRAAAPEKMLTTRKFADALGISESSIKRWADDGIIRAVRTPGGHRRIPLTEAVRFTRESDLEFFNPELIGLAPRFAASRRQEANDLVCQALTNGHGEEASAVLTSLFLQGMSVADLIDGPVGNALARIGELWKYGGEGIYIEHRALEILLRILGRLADLLPAPSPDAPMAIGCAPPGDVYLLPTLAAAMVFRELGWKETNFGADVPWSVLELAVEQFQPAALWLAFSAPLEENPEVGPAPAWIGTLANRMAEWNGAIYCGGRGVPSGLRRLPSSNVHVLESMNHLADVLRQKGTPSPAGGR